MIRHYIFISILFFYTFDNLVYAGKTTFDDLVESQGHVQFPITSLYEWHKKQNEKYALITIPGSERSISKGQMYFAPHEMLIPDGRSLQKDNATFSDPRVLFILTTDGQQASISKSELDPTRLIFFGYAPLSKQLEVISWNATDNRWEFQVVKDYAKGKVPRVETPNRTLCISCHQAEAPIFAGAPWQEVAVNSSFLNSFGSRTDDLLKRVIKERKGDILYEGIDLEGNGNLSALDANTFDSAVRGANRFLQGRKACSTVCGNNVACKRFLLLSALLKSPQLHDGSILPFEDFSSEKEFANFVKENIPFFEQAKVAIEKNWPPDGYSYPSSVLPDRDPLQSPEDGGTVFRLIIPDPKIALEKIQEIEPGSDSRDAMKPFEAAILRGESDITYDESVSESRRARLKSEKRVPVTGTDRSIADPKTPRPKVSKIPKKEATRYLAQMAFRCLGLSPLDADILSGYQKDELKQSVVSQQVQTLLNTNWPPSRKEIMTAVLQGLKATEIPHFCKISNDESIPLNPNKTVGIQKVTSAIAQSPSSFKRQNPLLHKYCAACHTGDNALLPLPLHDISAMRAYKDKKGRSALEKVKLNQMPPSGSSQPTQDEQSKLIKLLSF